MLNHWVILVGWESPCLVSSGLSPWACSLCCFCIVSFSWEAPYNEGVRYNVRYPFLDYHYMLNSLSPPSESPNLGMVLETLDTWGIAIWLIINKNSCECEFSSRKKLTNSLIILYMHLFTTLFFIQCFLIHFWCSLKME